MNSSAQKARGFTLVELLSSMVVGSLVLLAAASFLASTGDGYERVGGSTGTEREARAALSQLSADLASARFHPDSKFEESSTAWPEDQLGFLNLQPPAAQEEKSRLGDLCAVHYYLKDLTIGGKTVRCLIRGFRDSADAFKALQNTRVTELFAEDDTRDEPIAFGVLAFEARPKIWDPSTKQWQAWQKDPGQPHAGPQALDVRLVLTRRQLAGRLKSTADWDSHPQLGPPAEADRNPNLEIHGSLLRFGIHENL